ncbi:MAG: multicopper oxidase domain-containing protein [Candidatus Bathyarchaeota archaeon]|nr:multicopper oxidase domain-containing protein [Candidatus Bathyarchaeota archaeon]
MLFSSVYLAFAVPANPALLDPKTIPKYVNQLIANIPVYQPTNIIDGAGNVIRQDYTVDMVQLREQILPTGTPLVGGVGDGKTTVWGYAGNCYDATTGNSLGYFANSPSATFIATRGIPSQVTWVNKISQPQFLPVDPTIHWANPNNMPMNMPGMTPGLPPPYPAFPPGFDGTVTAGNPNGYNAQWPVPLVPHLHGGEVPSWSDGGPDAWWTYNGVLGASFSTNGAYSTTPTDRAVYYYPNEQNPANLWYHDHALGMTRLNVMSGLAGYYLLKDPPATTPITAPTANNFDQYLTQHFPYGVSEIPLAIQDRTFYATGELWFPTVGINPTINPYWMPEFFGNTIMVNGKVWPNLDVTQGWYRFRVLDGSNARFYTLSFSNKMPFTVIGSDGGYLMQPAVVTSLTIAPGERYDILVDFSAVPIGTKIILTNTARAPFPGGAPADPQTVGQVMQFTVAAASANPGATAPVLPATGLNPTLPVGAFPTLAAPPATQTPQRRVRTLFEVMGPAGPMMVTVNGQQWSGDLSEMPKDGTTEDWVIVNLTGDTHPIHLHLVTFQLLSRQSFQANKYMKAWLALNAAGGMPPFPTNYIPTELDPTPYLQGKVKTALPTEMGWKDTIQMNPGEVTVIRVRFTSNTGVAYPFDPTQGPGYVWHCHIIDHEDNEMMRPYKVVP